MNSKKDYGGVNGLVVFCQPFRKVNINIMSLGIRVFPGDQSHRTNSLENSQYKSLQ